METKLLKTCGVASVVLAAMMREILRKLQKVANDKLRHHFIRSHFENRILL
jgi:hypothetical protein